MPGHGDSPLQDDRYPARLAGSAGRLAAKLFVITDEVFSARQALDLGLVSMVVPDVELDSTGDRIAASIATYPSAPMAYVLRLIDQASS
jgi:2-(1,2-epoxy-1,2-dihydrophenyl)acetyl-CoA isomerase